MSDDLEAGLAAGLNFLAGSLKDRYLAKLEEERETRKEERQDVRDRKKAEEERARKSGDVEGKTYEQRDGVWYEQDINPFGHKIAERRAPENKSEEFNRQTQKEKYGIEKSLLEVGKLRREEGYAAEDRALDVRATKAKISSEEAQADYYRMGGSAGARAKEEDEGSQEDYVQELIKQSAGLRKQYVEGKDAVMTYSQFENVARNAIMEGAKRGVDPRSTFAEILRRYTKDPRFMKRKPLDEEDEEL